jgi:hypothetical protein
LVKAAPLLAKGLALAFADIFGLILIPTSPKGHKGSCVSTMAAKAFHRRYCPPANVPVVQIESLRVEGSHLATYYTGPSSYQEHGRHFWCLDDLGLIPCCAADRINLRRRLVSSSSVCLDCLSLFVEDIMKSLF